MLQQETMAPFLQSQSQIAGALQALTGQMQSLQNQITVLKRGNEELQEVRGATGGSACYLNMSSEDPNLVGLAGLVRGRIGID